MIKLPISIGDTILTGKFRNKKTIVKHIGKNELGLPTVNGKVIVNFRYYTEPEQTPIKENKMKLSQFKQIIREEVKKVVAEKALTENILNPKAFAKLFIQNVKNGLVDKPVTFKDLKQSLDYVTRLSGTPDLKKTHKKEFEEIIGHLAAFYNIEK